MVWCCRTRNSFMKMNVMDFLVFGGLLWPESLPARSLVDPERCGGSAGYMEPWPEYVTGKRIGEGGGNFKVLLTTDVVWPVP
jgi:hypothetical protein